ncbi:protein kinase domain-containing protein [Curtobacterium sp. BH-2-1-1]|uniref:protein kinase domain-containing protein n=1 Tax=Curtobacterium sp. BH-2-1-1 TaxID=1905847 RepID=UPI0011A08AD0|nr:protein kinase [Curtobacterium sp. BH-2-1-1]
MTERRLSLEFESIASLPEGVNEVRVVRDELLNTYRVAKRLDLSMLDASVLPEASTLQSIDHPNVVKVSSAARVEGYDPTMDVIEIHTPFYSRGSITDALLRGESFVGPSALAILQTSLRGLRELHMTHNVLHRDIKSGNILLAEPPVHALVADIGVAGKMDSRGFAPAVNNPTLYSPPEWKTGVLDIKADLYSMGLVLRELVGGRFDYGAYSREDVLNLLQQGSRALPEDVLELPAWVPSRLRKIYRKAIAVDPTARYSSARDMADALAKVRLPVWREVGPDSWTVQAEDSSAARMHRVAAIRDSSGIRLSMTRQAGSSFRRVSGCPDRVAPTLLHRDAASFFDQVNSLVAT